MATKYEEIYPIKLKVMYDKIAHQKVSINQMKQREHHICQIINFDFHNSSIYEITMLTIQLTKIESLFTSSNLKYFYKVIIYLTKMVMHDYSLLTNYSIKHLTIGLLYVSFKIIEQIDSQFQTDLKSREIIALFRDSDDTLYEVAQKVLNLAKNFETIHPGLENLKKFNGFQLDSK